MNSNPGQLHTYKSLLPVLINQTTSGRKDKRIMERAYIVGEVKEIKHYFTRGVQTRSGIEK